MQENKSETNTTPKQPNIDYQAIVERGPILYLILLPDSPKFTIIGASDAYIQATKKTRGSLIGLGIFEAFPENPDDMKSNSENNVRVSLERVLKSGKPDTFPVQKYDIPRPAAEGGGYEVRYWSPIHFPIFDADQKLIHIIHRVEDVTELMQLKNQGTEQNKLNEELKKRTGQMEIEVLLRAQEIQEANIKLSALNEKLKELDVLKTHFFANISHEFRTPLTLMIGPLEDLLEDPKGLLSPTLRAEIEVLQRNALRLLKLVNTLLDFSRIEAGRVQANYTATDLASLTNNLASTFRSAMEHAQLNFVVDCPPLSTMVFVDNEMWEKIVLNLLANSFKYTLQGEIKIALKQTSHNTVELTVSDTGTGIAKDEIPKIFERFHRVQNAVARTHEGTGIGLSLVRQLVELHGGTIDVQSTVGKGTTFTVNIPLGSEHLPQANKMPPEKNTTGESPSASFFVEEAKRWAVQDPKPGSPKKESTRGPHDSPRRILLADDNADMRDYISHLLSENYEVITANDGKSALEKLRQAHPDLVISDIMMPIMNGLEFLSHLRADSMFCSTPVILLSARAGEEEKTSGIDSGADDYLTKPFSAKELLVRVKTQLKLAEMRRQSHHELEQFAYVVSHDLQSPLRHIASYVDILKESANENLSVEALEAIHYIENGSATMQALITDLLSLAQVGASSLHKKQVDLNTVTKNILDMYSHEIQTRHAEIILEALPTVTADKIKISLVIQNLIGNAIKYSFKERGLKIKISALSQKESWQISIQDNGIGISTEHYTKIFKIFQRLHNKNEYSGTGIGLAICKKIIDLHGGRIWVTSKVGEGSTFYFEIPK